MKRGNYCSYSLTILTVLAKRTKLTKIDEYYDQIEKENKN